MEKRNRNSSFILGTLSGLLLLGALAMPGCGTIQQMYQGEKLARERVAVICWLPFDVTITDIDDLGPIDANRGAVEVLPGLHKFAVQIREKILSSKGPSRVYSANFQLVFNVEAGHEYYIEKRYGLVLVVMDRRSRRTITKTFIKFE